MSSPTQDETLEACGNLRRQHTPGPWFLHAPRIAQQFYIDAGAGAIQISFKRTSDAGADQMAPNARLIAAAPRLFDALETLVEAITTSAGRDFIEAFVRDASAALEEASPGWSKQDEPTAREMRQLGQVRAAAPALLAALEAARPFINAWPQCRDDKTPEIAGGGLLAQVDAAIALAGEAR